MARLWGERRAQGKGRAGARPKAKAKHAALISASQTVVWASTMSITEELVRNPNSWASRQDYAVRNPVRGVQKSVLISPQVILMYSLLWEPMC